MCAAIAARLPSLEQENCEHILARFERQLSALRRELARRNMDGWTMGSCHAFKITCRLGTGDRRFCWPSRAWRPAARRGSEHSDGQGRGHRQRPRDQGLGSARWRPTTSWPVARSAAETALSVPGRISGRAASAGPGGGQEAYATRTNTSGGWPSTRPRRCATPILPRSSSRRGDRRQRSRPPMTARSAKIQAGDGFERRAHPRRHREGGQGAAWRELDRRREIRRCGQEVQPRRVEGLWRRSWLFHRRPRWCRNSPRRPSR